MIVVEFFMSSGGYVNIDPKDIEGMTKEEITEYINEVVNESAHEECENSLEWEIEKE